MIVDGDGIRPDPKKVEAMRNLPVPTDVPSLRRFVGTVSYFRRFIPRAADILVPLVRLFRKGVEGDLDEGTGRAAFSVADWIHVAGQLPKLPHSRPCPGPGSRER
eukprot:Polyplicarium_translucidae@DN3595_c0_g1_i1.p2